MKPNTVNIVSLVLVLMAASSLVSMISTFTIDRIVHGDLYNYGLQFSYQWAMPYWAMTTIVFGMGWFNIIIAIAFQFYMLLYGRKEALTPTQIPTEPTPTLQPTKAEIIEAETKPTEKVEESKEQVAEPAEKVEEKKPEETQPLVEATSQPEQTETVQAEEAEGQKEQESKPAEESKTETKETSPTATETEQEQETPQKSEETPTSVEVPEEKPQTATEETPPQAGTSPL